jgi:hypothetical protein
MTISSLRHQPTSTTAALGIAGRAGWTTLRPPDGTELALAVRRYVWTELPGRTRTGAGPAADDRAALLRIAGRFPAAEQTFGRPALLALTRRPGPGTCGFCAAQVVAASLQEPAPGLASPALQALLGQPCRRCQARQRTRDHVAAVRAAGQVEQRALDNPDVNPFAARVAFWAHRLHVPGRIKGEAIADALRPRRPVRGRR